MFSVCKVVFFRGSRSAFGNQSTLISSKNQRFAIGRKFSTIESTKPTSSFEPKVRPKQPAIDFNLPLQSNHSIKKRVPKNSQESLSHNPEGFLDITCYGLAQLINLQELQSDLVTSKQYNFPLLPPELNQEVLLVSSLGTNEIHNQWDAFIFRNGVVVFWNLPKPEHVKFLDKLRAYSHGLMDSNSMEQEDLRFRYSKQTTRIVGEDILLQTQENRSPEMLGSEFLDDKLAYSQTFSDTIGSDSGDPSSPALIPTDDPVLLEKFAFSDALALSVKLSHLEYTFDTVAVEIEHWIANLKNGSRTKFTQSAVLRKTGELYTLRHLLNVGTSLIETPDFYWERPQIERLFHQLKSVLSVSGRTRVLNSRLDMCCQLTEILSNHLHSKHASRLEWMIIILILVEVGFEVLYYYERRQGRATSSEADSSY